MPKKKENKKFPSELRYDVISRDWVIIATGRAKRPYMFKKEKREKMKVSSKNCPFCNLETQEFPVLILRKGKVVDLEKEKKIPKDWTLAIIPNKYPAVIPAEKIEVVEEGPYYHKMEAVGYHEVVVTRSHTRSLAKFSLEEIEELLFAYQTRYNQLKKKKFVNHIFIFHNHGKEAGASIVHPHSQIITTPLLDKDLNRALINAKRFYKKQKKCVYCEMNKWERKLKSRIVYETQHFIALCPYASKSAFQIIISPKKHNPYFETMTLSQMKDLAKMAFVIFRKIYKGLGDPSYNFYFHTAPSDGKKYPYYHWHWTIIPKFSTPAGFEMSAGMEISVIEPERAAQYLRKVTI